MKTLPASSRGFSMVELVTVIAVMAILAAAAPSAMSMIESNRVRTATVELFGTLNWARSEAVKRNSSVTITPGDGLSDAWEDGWSVTVGGTEIGAHKALHGVGIITDTDPPVPIQYQADGRITAPGSKFQVDLASAVTTTHVRCLTIDPVGRPRIAKEECFP